jgi:hypothetical protein
MFDRMAYEPSDVAASHVSCKIVEIRLVSAVSIGRQPRGRFNSIDHASQSKEVQQGEHNEEKDLSVRKVGNHEQTHSELQM